MEYNFKEIESKWQRRWQEDKTYKVETDPSRPKFYVLDMFPYPSGAGLHVGHPLGYIASDIYSRYKRQKGFNVLHPMGYDAFGLPAEQYAIQTGQHPAVTTERNIARYREQLDKMTFADLVDNGKVIYSAADQKNDFWAFINKDSYLSKHIGEYSKRGGAVMPWQHMVNFKFSQDFYININGKRNTITLGVDINNLANLINRNWCGIDRLESSQILKYNTKTNAYNFTKPVWSKYASTVATWSAMFSIRYTFN